MLERRRLVIAVAVVAIGAFLLVIGLVRQDPGADVTGLDESGIGPGPVDPTEPEAHGPPASGHDSQDESGAVAAAAYYATVFDSEAFIDRDRRRSLLERFAASDAREELARSFDDVADTINARLDLSADVIDDPGFVWKWVPAGWKVRQYRGDEAVVAIWGVGVFVAQGRQLDQPGWSTVEIALRWERDAWRLVSVRNEPGPTPPFAGSVEASEVGRRIAGFSTFEYRPASGREG